MGENPPPWGLALHSTNNNRRQLPEWMDPKGEHGDIKFLLMKPVSPAKLPTYPFIISKSVEQVAGQIFGGHPTENGNSYLLKVRAEHQVEKLLKVNQLIDSTPVTITLHPSLNTCKCVVTCKEAEGASNDQLASDLASQGVTSVYRFQRKVNGKDVPTHTMVLTIQGTVIPRYIRFGFIQTPTRPYYSRPMLCLVCGKFGHTRKHCKHQPICLTCGDKEAHINCSKDPHCVNCQGVHPTNSRDCPAYKDEQEVLKIRTDLGISHTEALKELRKRQNSSSNIQQRLNQARSNNLLELKEQEILQLRKQVDLLTAQLAMFIRKPQHPASSENEDDETLNSSESDTTMATDQSKTTQEPTPKRNRQPTPEDSPTNSISSMKTTKKKKKRQQRLPDNFLPPDSQGSEDIPPYQSK